MDKIQWKDTIHGLTTISSCRTVAWANIRQKCKELNLEIPPINKIIEVKPDNK